MAGRSNQERTSVKQTKRRPEFVTRAVSQKRKCTISRPVGRADARPHVSNGIVYLGITLAGPKALANIIGQHPAIGQPRPKWAGP